jgi:hypothetical protein
MSNPMSGDQSPLDKAKEAASGLKDKLTGKGRQQEEQGRPGEDVPPPDENLEDPMPPDQQFPPQ